MTFLSRSMMRTGSAGESGYSGGRGAASPGKLDPDATRGTEPSSGHDETERPDMEHHCHNVSPQGTRESDAQSVASSSHHEAGGSASSCAGRSDRPSHTISKRETQAVHRIRLVVVAVLMISASLLAAGVYTYLVRSEERQWQQQFADDAHKILDAIGSSLDQTLGLLDGVAVAFVSVAHMTNQSWPYVTLPDFAVRMTKVLPLTKAININVLPLVQESQRVDWEAYSITNDDWVNDGMRVQEQWTAGYHGPIVYDGQVNGVLHSDFADLPYNTSRDFLPLWQNFPVIPNTTWTYNWDFLSFDFPDSYRRSIDHRKAVMAEAFMLPDPGDAVREAETQAWAEYYSVYLEADEEPVEPMSDLIYPVVRDMVTRASSGAEAATNDTRSHDTVGVIVATLYWRDFIRGILPEGSNGIHIVFSICEANFTYQINGPRVVYQGLGDVHDASYRHLGIHSSHEFDMRNPLYNGAKIDAEYCQYKLHLYPSAIVVAAHTTHHRTIFTAIVVLIFAFTSVVFYIYDTTVERRQRTVLQTAVRSSSIVSSLFPATVRDRLYVPDELPSNETVPSFRERRRSTMSRMSHRRSTILNLEDEPVKEKVEDLPIAELYLETTVLFADIAGFTAWSSERSPVQVFVLLETLYAAFDEIAKHRRIFKVETIGDCYVAVVGLPTPRKAHAVAMARFATDCRNKMQELTMDLEKKLGPGTSELALRIGLNSGPTTAGVLRGEKSRFQLFGDTVNTAARMESNGERNRIHVSHKTADLIRAAGKGHWLTPRDDPVHCKGKGLMSTYWCEPKAGSAYSSTLSESEWVSPSADGTVPSTVTTSDTSGIHSLTVQRNLVDWNVTMLTELVTNVVQYRHDQRDTSDSMGSQETVQPEDWHFNSHETSDMLPLMQCTRNERPNADERIELDESVHQQVFEFVSSLAGLHSTTQAFDNLEHASHVAMATQRLLDRLSVASHANNTSQDGSMRGMAAARVATHPLTVFAMLWAALLPDATNVTAQDDTVSVAWTLLLQPRFAALRSSLCPTRADVHHVRHVLVHAVQSQSVRNGASRDGSHLDEWTTPSDTDGPCTDVTMVTRNVQCLLQLLVQVSEAMHAMQHCAVYTKWYRCLWMQRHGTAVATHAAHTDHVTRWYDQELTWFDSYAIPLARAWHACGHSMGVAYDDLVEGASHNRHEWQCQGRPMLESLVASSVDTGSTINE